MSFPAQPPHPPRSVRRSRSERSPRRLRRSVLAAAAVALGMPLIGGGPAASPASAAANYLPAFHFAVNSDGGNSDLMPDCNSRNVTGTNTARSAWIFDVEYGPGSTVFVGDEWTVKLEIDQRASGGLINVANDGPDPLNVKMVPNGPVTPGKPTKGELTNPATIYYEGGGAVGPIGPFGSWGYSFDSNSGPTGLDFGDGTHIFLTTTLKATAPGVITLPKLELSGHDGTPVAGSIGCSLSLNWQWTVEERPGVIGAADTAKTDSRYDILSPHDANEGFHDIEIDVLANDDDPNINGGPGDTAQVRIADWQPASVKGGVVRCGTDQQKGQAPDEGAFNTLSDGPCTYRPPLGYSGPDSFGYVVRQKTANLEKYVIVNLNVLGNTKPSAADAAFGVGQDTDKTFDLAGFISVGPGEDMVCMPGLSAQPFPAAGTVTMHPDCSFDWHNTDGLFDGLVSFSFWVCDNHPLLTDAGVGAHADRADDYAANDFSATLGRRCIIADATINVLPGLVIPPMGIKDVDVVDAGYSGDGIGAYSVEIPVLANDIDPNGPNPTLGLAILDGPSVDEGVASVVGTKVRFTPADGFSGPVDFTYRVCEDPDDQNPPYQGFGFCGEGLVVVDVIGNEAPVANPDTRFLVNTSVFDGDDFNVSANDVDPEDEGLFCAKDPVSVSAPAKVSSVSLSPECHVQLDPADGATGAVIVTYEVCDDHNLSDPTFPSDPYGADGRSPVQSAPRCSTAEATITLFNPLIIDPGEPEGDPWADDPAPTCVDDKAVTLDGLTVGVDVTANDSDLDAENQPSDVILVGEPDVTANGGTVVLNADGTKLDYTPPNGFSGTDTFIYGVKDSIGHGCNATVSVEVSAAVSDRDTDGDGIPDNNGGDGNNGGSTTTTADANGAVSSGNLPYTGSGSSLPLALAGLGLVAAGAGMTGVARVSRRRTSRAS